MMEIKEEHYRKRFQKHCVQAGISEISKDLWEKLVKSISKGKLSTSAIGVLQICTHETMTRENDKISKIDMGMDNFQMMLL